MRQAQDAAIRFTKTLRPQDLAQVVQFNERATPLQTFTNDLSLLEKAIRATEASGPTALHNALYVALKDLGRELRNDPLYGLKITDEPEVLGVESIDSSAVVIRFLIKTRPQQQWMVKRETLRRIKKRFDELGIQLPNPQHTLLHKFPHGLPALGDKPGDPPPTGDGSRLWAA